MTLREWLDVYTHNGDSQLVCAWRKRAWRAMRPVVERFVADRDAGLAVSIGGLLGELDAACVEANINPTTKRWQQERSKILDIVRVSRELWSPPDEGEPGVCLVAQDLVEEHRYAEAIALLNKEAPRVHNRPCPACSAQPGVRCVQMQRWDGQPAPEFDALKEAGIDGVSRHHRIVPHLARVQP